jgi:hypothetical protein
VIRRYLVERMRLALASEADHPEPGEAELAAHLARHAERYRIPEQLRLLQVFVSSRHADATGRAEAIGRVLERGGPGAASGLGDPFPRGPRTVASRDALAQSFGAGFADALDGAAQGRWQGPVPSAYGLHWVWLDAPVPTRLPELREVRGRVRQDLLETRRAQRLRLRLDELRAGYEVRIE